jgi:hypothetical protein
MGDAGRWTPGGSSALGDQEDGGSDKGEQDPESDSVLETDCPTHFGPLFHTARVIARIITVRKKYSDRSSIFPVVNKYFLTQDFYKTMR